MLDKFTELIINANLRAISAQKELDDLGVGRLVKKDAQQDFAHQKSAFTSNEIYETLKAISEPLAISYAQVKNDLADTSRISWAGTAHEIRQIVSTMLHLLAPDNEVTTQADYKKEPNTSGPTQKQRAIYILEKNKAGSREKEVVAKISKFEEIISELIRDFYSRASDAAHTRRDKTETKRLLNYFEAFAHDLLDLR